MEVRGEPKEPLFCAKPGAEGFSSDNNLCNPESRNVAVLFYIYSMQFGSPPLSSVQNGALRTGDTTHLASLGPFSCAMLYAASNAEYLRKDKIKRGYDIAADSQSLGFLRASFMLFRGAALKQDQINDYKTKAASGDRYHLAGQTSCFESLDIGLKHAFGALDQAGARSSEQAPVLFVYTVQNYWSYMGVRLNNEAFTAYPGEGELLLCDGCPVYVLGVSQVVVGNGHADFAKYTGKALTVIYMAHLE